MNSILQNDQKPHSFQLISRSKLEIEGVIDVIDFDTSTINVNTTMGILQIEGDGLKIISLSRESSKIYVEGSFDSLFYYGASKENKKRFFRRANT